MNRHHKPGGFGVGNSSLERHEKIDCSGGGNNLSQMFIQTQTNSFSVSLSFLASQHWTVLEVCNPNKQTYRHIFRITNSPPLSLSLSLLPLPNSATLASASAATTAVAAASRRPPWLPAVVAASPPFLREYHRGRA